MKIIARPETPGSPNLGTSAVFNLNFPVGKNTRRLRVWCGCSSVWQALSPVPDDDNLVLYLQPSTDSSQTRSLIDHWLRTCLETHESCTNNSGYIPTRVLSLIGPETYRLVLRSECPPNSRYMTLSHCWGPKPAEEHFRFTQSTYDELRTPRSMKNLPRTFREAIEVTSRLGIRYLWIDRLCIYQDSVEDWRAEAASMQDVYRHSLLNICALRSSDDTAPESGPNPYMFNRQLQSIIQERTSFYGPLLDRGWILQERLLAPRALLFGDKQVFWECRERHACETVPFSLIGAYQQDYLPGRNYFSISSAWHLWKRVLDTRREVCNDPYGQYFLDWRCIVEEYSVYSLTMPSDKLVALSGLAADMRSALEKHHPCPQPYHYFAGIWEADLQSSLCWYVEEPGTRPDSYRAPSWSWASVDGSIYFHWSLNPNALEQHKMHHLITSCTAETSYMGDNDTGEVTNGRLDVTGPLARLDLDANEFGAGHFTQFIHPVSDEHQEAGTNGNKPVRNFYFDAQEETIREFIYCIPFRIVEERNVEQPNIIILAIALRRHEVYPESYRRIGSIRYSTKGGTLLKDLLGFFSRCPRDTITIF
ncbi:heterokaryon incompatibility protein-domain-containing protein [Lophiotrema nucula]|uniref:Heterokaryon incompatibility protein-domain-containing protein n=1 Tax=Lophiotrema nucula TaxID=690887 RepID=A0A6A5Z2G9_9PLEO|nr:heterokaryon incompatibility protein-domain-containing protein [Lophiotrema nucula]